MSFISDIISQRLRPTSDLPSGTLMRWTEPTSLYERKRQGAFYFVWPFLPFCALVILFFCHPHGMKNSLFFIFLAIALITGIIIILARRLPSTFDELKEDDIMQVEGGQGAGTVARATVSWSAYKDIECCHVHRDDYKGVKFSVLKIIMKSEHKFFKLEIVSPVTMIIIPEDINLDSVLQILRDKGVQIVER